MPDQISGILSPFLRKRRLKAARPLISGRTLDYGCGTGVLGEMVHPEDYTGVDIDPESISIARRRYLNHQFFTLDEFCEVGPYDTIVCLAVIEHVQSPHKLIHWFKDMLSLAGRVVLTTPHPYFDGIHAVGAALGLFSREGREEHQSLLDKFAIYRLAEEAGLFVWRYQRFLFGANQLVVLKRSN